MIDIAKAGGGIGIFPQPMVRGEVTDGALVQIDAMPALDPVEFHVAMRVADTEPVRTQIFVRAPKLNLADPSSSDDDENASDDDGGMVDALAKQLKAQRWDSDNSGWR